MVDSAFKSARDTEWHANEPAIVSWIALGSRWRSTETLTTTLATRTFPDSQVNRRQRNREGDKERERKVRRSRSHLLLFLDQAFHLSSLPRNRFVVRLPSRQPFTIFSFLPTPCYGSTYEKHDGWGERVRGWMISHGLGSTGTHMCWHGGDWKMIGIIGFDKSGN